MSPCVRNLRKILVQEKENRYELDKTLVSRKTNKENKRYADSDEKQNSLCSHNDMIAHIENSRELTK